MELYDLTSPAEAMLAAKADAKRMPLGGTMELTPLCNMNCKMCYIRQNPEEMKKCGRMLSCDEWLRIADEAKNAGVLYLLLTGGEPLVYPEFKRLYAALTDMGFVISINTNGTLIDEKWADFFAERRCRRMHITLYGKDDESYYRVTGNPKGHTQVMRAFKLLKERNIAYRINYTVSPDNIQDLPYACDLAKAQGVPLASAHYLFPPIRRDNLTFTRLTPQELAQSRFDKAIYQYNEELVCLDAKNSLLKMERPDPIQGYEGIRCRAGRSGFWMSWNGDLLPCGQFIEPRISLLDNSFDMAWKYIVEETAKLRPYAGCITCDKRNICHVCAAACLCESNGDMSAKPEYVCQTTQAYYALLRKYAEKEIVGND